MATADLLIKSNHDFMNLSIYSRFCANMALHYIIARLERICINQLIFCNLRFPIHFGGYLKGVLIKTQLKNELEWDKIPFPFPIFPISLFRKCRYMSRRILVIDPRIFVMLEMMTLYEIYGNKILQ